MANSSAYIWNGFSYVWDQSPHRLSILGSQFGKVTVDGAAVDTTHDFSLKVGTIKDAADYKVSYSVIKADDIFIGTAKTGELKLASKIEKSATRTDTIRVKVRNLVTRFDQMPLVRRSTMSRVKVLLNGFHIESRANPGWYFGGLAMSVYGTRWVSEEEIEFSLYSFVRPAWSPDPFTGRILNLGYDGWEVNEDCVYKLTVDFTIIAGAPENVAFADSTSKFTHVNVTSASFSDTEVDLAFAEPAHRYREAFMGMYGFELYLSSPDGVTPNATGRYFRKLSANVGDFSYDEARQRGTFQRQLQFSNEGPWPVLPFPWTLLAQHHVAMVGVNGSFSRRQSSVTGRMETDDTSDSKKLDAFH